MTACRNPEHASVPADYCAGCARDCEAELTTLNDRYMRLLKERSEWERQVRAAARREAQDNMRAFAHLSLGAIMDELSFPVRPALYRAAEIDPAMGRRQMDRSRLLSVKNEAGYALREWDKRTDRDRLAADRAARPDEAEVARLRRLIVAAGQRLHREVGMPFDGFNPCRCAGCGLIRDMDTAGLPGPDLAEAGVESDTVTHRLTDGPVAVEDTGDGWRGGEGISRFGDPLNDW